MKDLKEELIDVINYMDEKQMQLILDMIKLASYPTKHDLLKFAKANLTTYDTATPIDYYRRVEEIYPDFKNGCFVYDYTDDKFGSFLNINNLVVRRILNDISLIK